MTVTHEIADISRLQVVEETSATVWDGVACWEPQTYAYIFDDDDHLDLGRLVGPKSSFTPKQLSAALERLPDSRIYPRLSKEFAVTVAGEPAMEPRLSLKRPMFPCYHWVQKDAANGPIHINSIAHWFRSEVEAFELMAQHPPHPNIVQYHGCRVRRGFVTGILTEAVDGLNLEEHLRAGHAIPDKAYFMLALESAVRHLHRVVGMAHNDIKPANVVVRRSDGMPVHVDFSAARPPGARGTGPLGTPGWMETDDVASYAVSKTSHDLFGLKKLRAWLDKPEFSGEPALPSAKELLAYSWFALQPPDAAPLRRSPRKSVRIKTAKSSLVVIKRPVKEVGSGAGQKDG